MTLSRPRRSLRDITGRSGVWRALGLAAMLLPGLAREGSAQIARFAEVQRKRVPCRVLDPGAGLPDGLDREVHALEVFGRPGNEVLVAGGFFGASGSTSAMRIASWNGKRWTELGGGVGSSTVDRVEALFAVEGPEGPLLYVGGIFATVGGSIPAANVASWDGTSWSPLGQGLPFVKDFTLFDDGSGISLYAATDFSTSTPGGVWRLDGSGWQIVGGGFELFGGSGSVEALAVFHGELVAGGLFTVAGGEPAPYVAGWDGERWHDLGGGLNEPVFSMAAFDDGSGEELYCGGTFLEANSPPVPAASAARWNGSRWASLGNELPFQQFFGNVLDIEVFDDGDGPSLFFAADSGFGPDLLFEWSGGSAWEEVAEVGRVIAMAAYDDGAGASLHLGGAITSVEGVPTNNVARWVGCGPSLSLRSQAALGTTATLAITSPPDAGRPIFCGLSLTTSPGVPLPGGRTLPLAPDALFRATLDAGSPVISSFVYLDQAGRRDVALRVPSIPSLAGADVFAAFIVDPFGASGAVSAPLAVPVVR